MRAISKIQQPQELVRWRAENAAVPENLVYGQGGFPSEAIRQNLLREQFHLCAYTMRSLPTAAACQAKGLDTRSSCHIEHLLPQSRKVRGEDIDYMNMVSCYPPSQSKVACDFGAHAKADFDPSSGNFISPLSPNVESHFSFEDKGHIKGLTVSGQKTIDVLRLNHPILVNDRAAVIKGFLNPGNKKLSAQAARNLAARVLSPDNQGCLIPYCTAISEAALRHATREEKRANRINSKKRA